jgi:hypothetical protein
MPSSATPPVGAAAQPNFPSIPPQQITWPFQNPAQSSLPAPPAEDQSTAPWQNGANDCPLTVASPMASKWTPKNPMFFMPVYGVIQLAVYFTFNNTINTQIFMASGAHVLTVMAEDEQGYISATPPPVTAAQAPNTDGQTSIAGIQAMGGWPSCGGLFPARSGRSGQICAASGGTPQSTMTGNVTSPSMDGESAQFSMGPSFTGLPRILQHAVFQSGGGRKQREPLYLRPVFHG